MASATVFPDGRIEDKHLKNLCALFDVVHIGMPWVMEPTPAMIELSAMGLLKIHRPEAPIPSGLDPRTLLNDYKNWVMYGNEKSFSSFAKAALLQTTEESRWEISQAVKQMARGGESQTGSPDIYPFVLLHLYQQVQEDKGTADRALESINISGSPLAEALGKDMEPEFHQTSLGNDTVSIPIQEETLAEVLESWCSIFGPLLTENQVAVTPNPQIFDLIVERVEERLNKDLVSASVLKTPKISLPSCENLSIQEFSLPPIAEMRKKVGQIFSRISNDSDSNKIPGLEEAMEGLNGSITSLETEGKAMVDLKIANFTKLMEYNVEKHEFLRFFTGKLIMTVK